MASSSSAQATPATTVADDPDIDAEKIQSTVDVSLSLALSLVQTWMPSASSAPLDQSVVQSRKKLEEYMRRPPRLGVGTPIPTAQHTQATYHETQKLKNRLVGSGAARRKAEEETKLNGTGSKRPGSHSDEEDDSESRANAMKKKQARTGINGLSVFGGGKGGKGSKPNSNTEAQPQPQANAAVTSTPVRERTPPAPTSPTCSFSSTAKASPEPSASTEADAGTRSSPHAKPPAIQTTPDEPMGIHKLPAKLPLASKIWPQSPSPPQSKRRKTLTAMLPPQSPSHTWNLALPRHSLSSSASESVASSSVPSSSATDPGLDSTARLSRKERKRLRKAAQQTESLIQENAAKDLEGRPADPGRDSVSESKSRDACASPPDLGVVAMTATSTPRARPTEADLDDSDGDDDESEEMVSRTSEEHRVVAQDDTMQDGGKKKRKRRARKKPGTG
ncbi:unnamed protein product [Rhizoctonia solani]|uniref:Uncharacterized protein n=1 Tax=Rhizoctonia solani TaxID=456999 RepID=A0A8H3EES4_9AGAM|nr:unnamed protein product [Rhizoctonia solani]